VANATASAAREAREAKAVTEAARSLARHPGEPLARPPEAQTDTLANLRAEQEKIVQKIEACVRKRRTAVAKGTAPEFTRRPSRLILIPSLSG